MKWLLFLLGLLLLAGVAVWLTGTALPALHVATVRASYGAPPDRVYNALIDIAAMPAWRSELDSVRPLQDREAAWVEYGRSGAVAIERDLAYEPHRIVTRVADDADGFGGTWTYELTERDGGTVLAITERGVVHNPVFRFFARFVFGHHRPLETFAADLGRHLGEEARVRRVRH